MPYHPSNPTHLEAVGPHGAGVVVVGQHQRHCGVATLVLGAGQGPVHIARKAVQLDGAGAKLRGGTRGGTLMAKCEAPNQRCGQSHAAGWRRGHLPSNGSAWGFGRAFTDCSSITTASFCSSVGRPGGSSGGCRR